EFPLVLHGGEPLLWGVDNFHRLAAACEEITARTECHIPIGVTTNGLLIDEAWVDCFKAHDITVPITLHGPAPIHDAPRRTFQTTGTHAGVERAARLLLSRDVEVTALAVCNPRHEAREYVDFFASCGLRSYDIMIPDATVDERPPSIAAFYKNLFDLW